MATRNCAMSGPSSRRSFKRWPSPSFYVWLVIALVVAARLWQLWDERAAPVDLAEGDYLVERVVDGDTIKLANGAVIRIIGVDTPETVRPEWPVEPWGPEASRFTREFIGDGPVRLQFDRERLDDYGRYLAYVWVGDRMLNEELVRSGLARFKPWFNYSETMKSRFRRAQNEAQAERRGIWSQPRQDQGVRRAADHRRPRSRHWQGYMAGKRAVAAARGTSMARAIAALSRLRLSASCWPPEPLLESQTLYFPRAIARYSPALGAALE